MAKEQVGTVSELWRFPVKSMLGEKLPELNITPGGVIGDRAYALREVEGGRVVSAKKWGGMFRFEARYTVEPTASSVGEVLITMPGGRTITVTGKALDEIAAVLASVLGRKVRFERAHAGEASRGGIDPATVFADVPVEQVIPGLTAATMPDSFSLLKGTFFDSAAIHVIATGTLDHLRSLRGGEGQFDPRRLRANIYVKTDPELTGFVEDRWTGGLLQVGPWACVGGMRAALRCVMTTHPQYELPQDYGILRAAAQHHQANLGVFGSIQSAGVVRVGDPVYLVTQ